MQLSKAGEVTDERYELSTEELENYYNVSHPQYVYWSMLYKLSNEYCAESPGHHIRFLQVSFHTFSAKKTETRRLETSKSRQLALKTFFQASSMSLVWWRCSNGSFHDQINRKVGFRFLHIWSSSWKSLGSAAKFIMRPLLEFFHVVSFVDFAGRSTMFSRFTIPHSVMLLNDVSYIRSIHNCNQIFC